MNRRRFLQTSLATGIACGLAQRTYSASADVGQLVDTHVYVDRWPFERFADDAPSKLVHTLRSQGVAQAWVGSFDGLFHKDIAAVNSRLAETCREEGNGLLIPFGSVNLSLPDWEEDVRRCQEVHHMRGIRLHPNYHGYTLDDPRFARLLALAAERKLVVQLVAWMTDSRHKFLTPRDSQVDLELLAGAARSVRGLRLLIANGSRPTDDAVLGSLVALPNVYVDSGRCDSDEELTQLVGRIPSDRIVFGSTAPLMRVETAAATLQDSGLSVKQRRAIRSENAMRFL